MKDGSGIVLVHERTDDDDGADQPPAHVHGAEADSSSWQSRSRVELYREHANSVLVAA